MSFKNKGEKKGWRQEGNFALLFFSYVGRQSEERKNILFQGNVENM
jgi:hypothetical protein